MPSQQSRSTTVIFLTDLHLDRAKKDEIDVLLHRLRNTRSDSVILTGDISDAGNIRRHLSMLAAACAPRPLNFIVGNHDFYGGSFEEVENELNSLCGSTPNLHQLDGSRIVPLAKGIGLIGHRGWPDARAGNGMASSIENPDRWSIKELRNLDQSQLLERMQFMGRESAAKLRSIYPLALTRYRHVIVATHVPPFDNAVFYKNRHADDQHLPHFCNLSVGVMLLRVLRAFPDRRVSVLAGHSHGSCIRRITQNLTVRVGASRYGRSIPMEVLRFAA